MPDVSKGGISEESPDLLRGLPESTERLACDFKQVAGVLRDNPVNIIVSLFHPVRDGSVTV
jgi:hypothetical protein